MACSGCGGKTNKSSSTPVKTPSAMRTGTKIFNFGPYGQRASKVITGRVPASSLRPRKK